MSSFGVLRRSFALMKGRKGTRGATFIPIPSYGAEPKTPPPENDPTTGWIQGKSMRVGVLGRKMGMACIYDEWGNRHAVTAIKVDDHNTVVQVKRDFSDGYTALQVGAGVRKLKNTSLPMQGHFARVDVAPKQKLVEFRVTPDALIEPGTPLGVRHFRIGQMLDISGTSKGKGFAGVMKRWGFAGGPASHGASRVHRAAGSTGQRQDPGRVFPNKKMAGHMGAGRVTVKNLVLYRIFDEMNVLLVVGCIPGPKGAWLEIRDAKNKPHQRVPPFPTVNANTPPDRQQLALFKQPQQASDVEG